MALLVGGSLFILFTGVMAIAQWVPWEFRFRQTHFWTAWIVIGALVAHIGAKLPITRRALARGRRGHALPMPAAPHTRARLAAAGRRADAPRPRRERVRGRRRRRADDRRPDVRAAASGSRCSSPRRPGRRARRACPSTARRRPPGCSRPRVPPDWRARRRGRRRAPLRAVARRPARDAAAPRRAADRMRRGLERERDAGAASRSPTCSTRAGAPAGASAAVESLQTRGGLRRSRLNPAQARARAHAARAADQRRAAAPRPRLPVPAHRAQPPRRAADEVGHADRGAAHERTSATVRAASSGPAAAVGAALVALRRPRAWSRRRSSTGSSTGRCTSGGAIVLHDALLAPIALGRRLAARAPRAGARAAGAAERADRQRDGRRRDRRRSGWRRARARYPDNATILPDASYPANLALVLGAVWLVALAAIALRLVRAARAEGGSDRGHGAQRRARELAHAVGERRPRRRKPSTPRARARARRRRGARRRAGTRR